MGNSSYLCCSNVERTYPSFRNRRFRPQVHTIACARHAVPLLWLALFGPDDLRTDELLSEDGEDLGEPAPLATKAAALGRLHDGVTRLERILPNLGPLGAHASFLEQSLKAVRELTCHEGGLPGVSPRSRHLAHSLRAVGGRAQAPHPTQNPAAQTAQAT